MKKYKRSVFLSLFLTFCLLSIASSDNSDSGHILLNNDINSSVKPLDQVHWTGIQWVSQAAPTIEEEDVYPYGTCLELLGGNKANIFSYNNTSHLEYHYISTLITTENLTPTPDGTNTAFSLTCTDKPTEPGSFILRYTIGTQPYEVFDDAGNFMSTHISSGTVDYVSGIISITFNTAPDAGIDVSMEYQENNVIWTGTTNVVVNLAEGLSNNYSNINTVVGMCLDLGDLVPTKSKFSQNLPGGGNFNVDNLVLTNKGTIEQRWTLLFSNGADYTCTGDTVGSVGGSNYVSTFSPNNPDQNSPYLTISPSCWETLNAQMGDTVIIDTHPSSFGIWWRENVPINTVAYSNNITLLELYVE